MNRFTSNNVSIRYSTEGTGQPAIVFINSLGTDLSSWENILPYLRGVQLVRYDKRGHGLSDVPAAPYTIREHSTDLLALLDHLEIQSATLVGVSVGGMIALDFAAQHPERVDRMIVMDTAGKIGNDEGWNTRIGTLRAHGMGHLADAILERWFAPSADADIRAVGNNMLRRSPLEGYIGTCEAIRDADLRPTLADIRIPTLVLVGADDGATTPELVAGLAAALPNARFEKIANAGHLPGWEQPEATANAIKRFLKETEAAAKSRYDIGMGIRRQILGDAHVDRSTANATDFDADFQRFITEFAWGTAWNGGTLDKPTRHIITLALLAALGKEHEFAMHVRVMQNAGSTPAQLKEALHQVAIYAGVPAANTAIGIAKKIFAEETETAH